MKKNATILLLLLALSVCYGKTIISIDSSMKYQTIDGWEAVSNRLESKPQRDTLTAHMAELIDLAVNDVGITRLRLGINSGLEDTVDHFTRTLNDEISYDEYKLHRYSKINDNDDPFNADPAGFQMSIIDYNMEQVILPFKKAVEARGDRFYLNFCYVDFADQSEFHHSQDPEEYAEFITYVWKYMDDNYGFTPDGLEVILEPDNADIWNMNHLPSMIEAVGDRLSSMEYDPEIIAPSCLAVGNSIRFFEKIVENDKALSYMDVLSYHRYGGNNDTIAQQELVQLAEEHDLKLAMLEYDKNSDAGELHYDLKYNNNVAWTKYALAYKSDEKFSYVFVNASDGDDIQYGVCKQTKYLRQYFRYIRPGAVRIEAQTDDEQIDPIAFINKNGNQVVVIKADKGDEIEIKGLPAGKYEISYTIGNYNWGGVDPKQYDVLYDEESIGDGESISFQIPDMGIATINAIETTTYIESIKSNDEIYIYPNPANEKLSITGADQRKIISIKIYDLLGNEMIKINNYKRNIDISYLARGMYVIHVNTERGQKSRKLIVE